MSVLRCVYRNTPHMHMNTLCARTHSARMCMNALCVWAHSACMCSVRRSSTNHNTLALFFMNAHYRHTRSLFMHVALGTYLWRRLARSANQRDVSEAMASGSKIRLRAQRPQPCDHDARPATGKNDVLRCFTAFYGDRYPMVLIFTFAGASQAGQLGCVM